MGLQRLGHNLTPEQQQHPYWNGQNLEHRHHRLWWGCGPTGTLTTAGGNAMWCSHFGRWFGGFLEKLTNSYHMRDPAVVIPWYLSKGTENLYPRKNQHTDVYRSFIQNCRHLEAAKMSFSRWMDCLIVVHPDNGILFNIKLWYKQTRRIVQHWKEMSHEGMKES